MNTAQQWPLMTTAARAPWLFGLAFDAPLIGLLQRWPDNLHAVTMEAVIDGSLGRNGRGTFESACGIKGLRLLGKTIDDRQVAALWPPRLKGMPDRMTRCRECWETTGRMRPRTEWRDA